MSYSLPYLTDKVFDFDDVMLVPQECVVTSRSETDVTAELGDRKFNIPVMPANMSTIVDEDTCIWLAVRGYFYVMHRFDIDAVGFARRMKKKNLPISLSLGVKSTDYNLLDNLKNENLAPDYLTIDVAHGDSSTVRSLVGYARSLFPKVFVIAGNIATSEAAVRLAEAGADAVKVGIAPGSVCTTGPNTGFGSRGWQLSAVANVAFGLEKVETKMNKKVYLIADGGVRQSGDIAKALAFGADWVMVGGMLSGHDENPGDVITDENGNRFKEFFGSASAEQKGDSTHVEGKSVLNPYKGSLTDTLQALEEHLQSSVSYSGGSNLKSLKNAPHVILR